MGIQGFRLSLSSIDNFAQRSQALASGAGPKGHGSKPHSCHTSIFESAFSMPRHARHPYASATKLLLPCCDRTACFFATTGGLP